MPRGPRKPGPRENRSDLPAPGTLQNGRPYGARADTEAALSAVPMPSGGTEDLAATAAGPSDPFSQFVAAAQGAQPPGQGLLSSPTDSPDEPVTAGLDIGAGPGPEALPQMLATQGPDPAIALWAGSLPALGLLASLPGSSPEVQQYYRRIRAQLPADHPPAGPG